MKKSDKTLGIVGLVATVIGFLASLLSNWVGKKQQDAVIGEKVDKAVKRHFENQ